MDTTNSKINVLIIGATGKLGSAVTKRCLEQPSLTVNIFVRDPQKNKELTNQVTQAGGKVIQGDVTKPETLKGSTKGMHTVIMTFDSSDEKVVVDGQIAVVNDCIENNVERIVPAEYSTNPYKFSEEELQDFRPIFNQVKVREYLKTVPIKRLNVNTGILLDWFLGDMVSKGFDYWGDASGNTKLQLTSYDDTAKVIAAAVAKKERTGNVTYVSNEVSMNELAEIYNKVRGTNLKTNNLGSLEDLRAKKKELEEKGDENAEVLKLSVFLFDERAKFDKTDNTEFEEVKKTSVEEFLNQNPNILIEG